jgi:hypothetical protein
VAMAEAMVVVDRGRGGAARLVEQAMSAMLTVQALRLMLPVMVATLVMGSHRTEERVGDWSPPQHL